MMSGCYYSFLLFFFSLFFMFVFLNKEYMRLYFYQFSSRQLWFLIRLFLRFGILLFFFKVSLLDGYCNMQLSR